MLVNKASRPSSSAHTSTPTPSWGGRVLPADLVSRWPRLDLRKRRLGFLRGIQSATKRELPSQMLTVDMLTTRGAA
jgi:hypothetical protein